MKPLHLPHLLRRPNLTRELSSALSLVKPLHGALKGREITGTFKCLALSQALLITVFRLNMKWGYMGCLLEIACVKKKKKKKEERNCLCVTNVSTFL